MKITVLIENIVYRRDLVAEHGLALHIDTGTKKILFDTGQTGVFADNAFSLGINLSDVDYLVISHGHFDHTGGINRFLGFNSKAKVLINRRALNPKYKIDEYIGIPQNCNIPNERFQFIENHLTLMKNVHVLGDIKTVNIKDTHFGDFYEEYNGEIIPDTFNDELVLCLETGDGIHLVSGCSHNGISNILATAKNFLSKPVISLMGGFHLVNSTNTQVEELAIYLNNANVKKIYTGHCTGLENYNLLKEYSKATVDYIHTASVINV